MIKIYNIGLASVFFLVCTAHAMESEEKSFPKTFFEAASYALCKKVRFLHGFCKEYRHPKLHPHYLKTLSHPQEKYLRERFSRRGTFFQSIPKYSFPWVHATPTEEQRWKNFKTFLFLKSQGLAPESFEEYLGNLYKEF